MGYFKSMAVVIAAILLAIMLKPILRFFAENSERWYANWESKRERELLESKERAERYIQKELEEQSREEERLRQREAQERIRQEEADERILIRSINMRTILQWIGGIVMLVIVAIFIIGAYRSAGPISHLWKKAQQSKFETKSNFDMAIRNYINDRARSLPAMIDSQTRLDTIVGDSKGINHLYTMVNYSIDELDINYFRKVLRTVVLNKTCTSVESQYFLKRNVVFTYSYYDKYGKQIATATFDATACKQALYQ